jgi:site-specific DNA-methyltransferase (adenine-specific)
LEKQALLRRQPGLKLHIKDESVDLIYLDPPFNSNATYNVLFAEQNGSRAAAQLRAFEDTWTWDQAAAKAYQEVVEAGGKVSQALQAFRMFLGNNDMLAYLAMMAPRLVELRRVLKPTGSIYLHCDPTASHYIKLLLDAIFSPQNFGSEIIWQRSRSHGGATSYHATHDVILYYNKTQKYIWNATRQAYDQSYIDSHYYPSSTVHRLPGPSLMKS